MKPEQPCKFNTGSSEYTNPSYDFTVSKETAGDSIAAFFPKIFTVAII